MHADRRLANLAGRQKGLVTLGQARHLGLGRGAIAHRIRVGRLHRVHEGVFAVGHGGLSDDALLLAAVMACGPLAGLSHGHALYLYGLTPPWQEIDLAEIDVSVPEHCGRGRRPGIRVHRVWLPSTELTTRRGIPVTTAARAIADYAAGASTRELERTVSQAVSERLVTVADLRKAASARPRAKGPASLARLLGAAERFDSVTASVLEERFLDLVRDAGLPAPALNQRVEGMRVDAIWRKQRVAAELDGYRWHRSRSRQENDRRREAQLRRAGWVPLRYSARQVFEEPLLVVSDLAAVLARR